VGQRDAGLTTGHGSYMPSAWGADEFIAPPGEWSQSGSNNGSPNYNGADALLIAMDNADQAEYQTAKAAGGDATLVQIISSAYSAINKGGLSTSVYIQFMQFISDAIPGYAMEADLTGAALNDQGIVQYALQQMQNSGTSAQQLQILSAIVSQASLVPQDNSDTDNSSDPTGSKE